MHIYIYIHGQHPRFAYHICILVHSWCGVLAVAMEASCASELVAIQAAGLSKRNTWVAMSSLWWAHSRRGQVPLDGGSSDSSQGERANDQLAACVADKVVAAVPHLANLLRDPPSTSKVRRNVALHPTRASVGKDVEVAKMDARQLRKTQRQGQTASQCEVHVKASDKEDLATAAELADAHMHLSERVATLERQQQEGRMQELEERLAHLEAFAGKGAVQEQCDGQLVDGRTPTDHIQEKSFMHLNEPCVVVQIGSDSNDDDLSCEDHAMGACGDGDSGDEGHLGVALDLRKSPGDQSDQDTNTEADGGEITLDVAATRGEEVGSMAGDSRDSVDLEGETAGGVGATKRCAEDERWTGLVECRSIVDSVVGR